MSTDVNFVAHQDDDVFFMQPDIIDSYINGSVGQVTVYLTCGNDEQWDDLVYIRRREQGAMDAYAQMGLIRDIKTGENPGLIRWSIRQNRDDYEPLVATIADCLDYPDLHLIFLRLSGCRYTSMKWHIDWEDREVTPHINRLEDLWDGNCKMLETVDQSAKYDKNHLILGLTQILEKWCPRVIRTLNKEHSTNDHPDHYYSALFAQSAIGAYSGLAEYWTYRGYDIESENQNVFGNELCWKKWMFYCYAYNDSHFGSDVFARSKIPPADTGNNVEINNWLLRQYHQKQN